MIGRGATKNPWIFRQTAALLSGGAVTEPTLADRRDLILQHFRWVSEREPSGFALHKLRKFTVLVHPRPAQRQEAAPAHQRSARCGRPSSQAVEDFFGELMLEQAA